MRWDKAKRIVEEEAKFMELKNEYGSGQTLLKMKLRKISKSVVREQMTEANEIATIWIKELNAFYA